MSRGNMRGRGRGRGNFRSNQPGNTGAKPKNTLKFDNDYDFEQANTEFEELRYVLVLIYITLICMESAGLVSCIFEITNVESMQDKKDTKFKINVRLSPLIYALYQHFLLKSFYYIFFSLQFFNEM